MPPKHAKSNACSVCARSKRRCDRRMPACARCAERNVPCVYPPSRSRVASWSRQLQPDTLRVSSPRMDDGLLSELVGNTSACNANPMVADDLTLDLEFPFTDSDFVALSPPPQIPTAPVAKADWFLAPETWRINHRVDSSAAVPVGSATMKKYVVLLQSWFDRWVNTGSNPFIHANLYSAKYPACLQVAYVTLASYIHRTPANTDTVLQIVEDRSNDLLRENRVGVEDWADGGEGNIYLFAQLTRLHALMVYQLIGLFDGDIRARYVAESHMDVQDSWAGKLFHSAAKVLSYKHADASHLIGCQTMASNYSQQQWYLWILSESIRRTWLVAVSFSSIFSALQQHWSVCPGGIMFTTRSGLWNATSATEWEEQCMTGDVAFLHRFECGSLFQDADPADVDEFGTAILDMTFDEDTLGKWRNRIRSL